MGRGLVSLIVTSRNDEKTIPWCLQSLREQTYKEIEIIVVDSHSTDRTFIQAQKLADRVITFGPDPLSLLEIWELAKGETLALLDAKMIVAPSVVEKCVDRMERKSWQSVYVTQVALGNDLLSRISRFKLNFSDEFSTPAVKFLTRRSITGTGLKAKKRGLVKTKSKGFSPELKDYLKNSGVEASDFGAVIFRADSVPKNQWKQVVQHPLLSAVTILRSALS